MRTAIYFICIQILEFMIALHSVLCYTELIFRYFVSMFLLLWMEYRDIKTILLNSSLVKIRVYL